MSNSLSSSSTNDSTVQASVQEQFAEAAEIVTSALESTFESISRLQQSRNAQSDNSKELISKLTKERDESNSKLQMIQQVLSFLISTGMSPITTWPSSWSTIDTSPTIIEPSSSEVTFDTAAEECADNLSNVKNDIEDLKKTLDAIRNAAVMSPTSEYRPAVEFSNSVQASPMQVSSESAIESIPHLLQKRKSEDDSLPSQRKYKDLKKTNEDIRKENKALKRRLHVYEKVEKLTESTVAHMISSSSTDETIYRREISLFDYSARKEEEKKKTTSDSDESEDSRKKIRRRRSTRRILEEALPWSDINAQEIVIESGSDWDGLAH